MRVVIINDFKVFLSIYALIFRLSMPKMILVGTAENSFLFQPNYRPRMRSRAEISRGLPLLQFCIRHHKVLSLMTCVSINARNSKPFIHFVSNDEYVETTPRGDGCGSLLKLQ